MHLFTAASLKNRALIALVTIVAALFGVISVGSLKQELMPSVQFPAVAVITSYPGASPEVVNNDVSEPIETALRAVPNLESTTATSSTGASTVVAEFTYGVDTSVTEQRVERAISRISQMLPDTVDPQVMSGSIDDFPVIQIAVTPPEDGDAEETAKLVERISLPELSDLDGVREAQLSGARGDRITIQPDGDELEEQSISAQSITDTLQQSGVLIAAGTVTDDDRTLAVQAGSDLTSVDDIADLPVVRSADDIAAWQAQQQADQLQQGQFTEQQTLQPSQDPNALDPSQQGQDPSQQNAQQNTQMDANQQSADGQGAALPPTVTIGEVADVALEANPVESISRVNGAPALTIGVTKVSTANTVDVSHAVSELLPDLESALDGAELSVIFDQAPYVEESIETLSTEGMLGLLFAVIVILVFLMSLRATLVTAISIPTSVLLTIIGLNFAEYSLNMLTLGALTISIGRVVDDSIVVIENIKRHLTVEADRAGTIIRAVKEVAGAITSSTVATMAVFLPVAFVDGMVGELFRPFSFTAAFALAASLLVSLTIVPVLAYWFLKPASESRRPKFLTRRGAVAQTDPEAVTGLQRGYRPIIEWTLNRPKTTLSLAVVVLILTMVASPLMKTNFMGDDEQNSVGVTQALEPGTSLSAQLAQAERTEEALATVSEVETVQVTIGSGGDGMAALFGSGGDGTISYAITTDPDANQSEVQDQIRAAVDGLDDAGEFSIGMSDGGVTMSSAIEIYVTAPDQETLGEASDAVVAELQDRPGLVQVESDLATSRPYLRIEVDREAAAEAGLSEAAVASIAAQRMQPEQIGQITIDENNIDVYLSEGETPDTRKEVAAIKVPTADGEKRLSSLAEIEVADGPVTVRTENAVRMVTVSALSEGDDLGVASAEVVAALDTVELPAGTTANIGGVMSQQEEAFAQLGIALLAAILIVYVVMVATFKSLLQPLLLLVSVPFSATGAILLLVVTGIPLGVASLVGVLMLIGIVVTNAIVLVDLVNQFRARGESLRHAVLHGSLLRLRPIVMTALATILALTPMGLGITGKGGFISQPLAVVVIGGLLSSTVLTLVVLPTLYYIVERGRERRRERRIARRAGAPLPGGGAGAAALAGVTAGVGAGIETGASGASGLVESGGPAPAEPGGSMPAGAQVYAGAEDPTYQAIPGVVLAPSADEEAVDAPLRRSDRRRGIFSRRSQSAVPAEQDSAELDVTEQDLAEQDPAEADHAEHDLVDQAPVEGTQHGSAVDEDGRSGGAAEALDAPQHAEHAEPAKPAAPAAPAEQLTPIVLPEPEPEPEVPGDSSTDAVGGRGPVGRIVTEDVSSPVQDVDDSELMGDDEDQTGEISDELADLLGSLGLPVSSAWDAEEDLEDEEPAGDEPADDDSTGTEFPDEADDASGQQVDAASEVAAESDQTDDPGAAAGPDNEPIPDAGAEDAPEAESAPDAEPDPADAQQEANELGWTDLMRQVRQQTDSADGADGPPER